MGTQHDQYLFQSTRGPEGPRDLGRLVDQRGVSTVSIHARPRRTARRHRRAHGHPGAQVSIHARPRRTARLPVLTQEPPVTWFQSTRGPEGPRDAERVRWERCPAVSIHARPRRTARPRWHPLPAANEAVSIHARPRRTARLGGRVLVGRAEEVSIHARPRRTARQRVGSQVFAKELFQSTRGPEGPRDSASSSRPMACVPRRCEWC